MITTFSQTTRLVPATVALLDLEDVSVESLVSELSVANPPSWPPEHNGPETRAWLRSALVDHPEDGDWYAWYVIAMINDVETLAGISGFKGRPTADGEVEIGYSIVPELQRIGIATVAVRMLCERAFAAGVSRVIADTLPSLIASQGVLIKTGFERVETFEDPEVGEVWRYRLDWYG